MSTSIPMVDLHLHSESAARIDRLLAERDGRAPYDWAAWKRRLMALEPGVKRLELMNGEIDVERFESLDSLPGILGARIEQTMIESADDGAVLIEVRFGRPTAYRADLIAEFRSAEARVRGRVRERAAGQPTGAHRPFFAEPLVLAWPEAGGRESEGFVKACLRLRAEGLAGIDFLPVPYDSQADWRVAHRWAERFHEAGLGITSHAGEFSTANVEAALDLPGLSRLGHGIHIVDDDRLLQRVIDQKVTLECCLTSNLVYGGLADTRGHPVRRLVEAGAQVTLNSDCPVRLCTSVGNEYRIARQLGFDDAELLQMTSNAIAASFTTDERKAAVCSWMER